MFWLRNKKTNFQLRTLIWLQALLIVNFKCISRLSSKSMIPDLSIDISVARDRRSWFGADKCIVTKMVLFSLIPMN